MEATVFEIAGGVGSTPSLVKGVGTKRLGKRRVNLILVGGGGKKEKASPAPESTSAVYHARAMKLSRERALVKNFSKRQKN